MSAIFYFILLEKLSMNLVTSVQVTELLLIYRYLAPEYFNGANVTEKVDIYAFGLVLLELITSQKTWDMQWQDGQQFSLENFFSHLLSHKNQLLHPQMAGYQLHNLPCELQAIGHAASLCLQKDPDLRPPMSKVFHSLHCFFSFMYLYLSLLEEISFVAFG